MTQMKDADASRFANHEDYLRDRCQRLDVELKSLQSRYRETVRALERGAAYLDALEANLLRNDADMLLDKCESPEQVADEFRAIISAYHATEKQQSPRQGEE